MATTTTQPEPTLLAVAAKLREWFPELQGRCIAVSEADITKENLPTLPFAMVALISAKGAGLSKSHRSIDVTEDIAIEFWLKVERYRAKDGSETPFWAYYDYEPLRDKVIAELTNYISPRGGFFDFRTFDVDSQQFAVALMFRFEHTYKFCSDDVESIAIQAAKNSVVLGPGSICAKVEPKEQLLPEAFEVA